MAHLNGEKPEGELEPVLVPNPKGRRLLLMLRVVAFLATASATIVMSLNKETKTIVVAVIGTTPIKATVTAKFQHNPAFVFFVIANANASFHNLLMILVETSGHKFDHRGLRHVVVAVLDMMVVSVASAGDGAATFMGELGKHGNSHAQWNKICDKVETFCNHSSWAILVSYAGLGLMVFISVLSMVRLLKATPANRLTDIP